MELNDFLSYTIDPDASAMEALANNQRVKDPATHERATYKLNTLCEWESPNSMCAFRYKKMYRRHMPTALGTHVQIKHELGENSKDFIKRILTIGFRPAGYTHILDIPEPLPQAFIDLLKSVRYTASYDHFQFQSVRKAMSDRGHKTVVFGRQKPSLVRCAAFYEYCKQIARIRERPLSLDFCIALRNSSNIYSVSDQGFESYFRDQENANSI